jgi:hypothetical protein
MTAQKSTETKQEPKPAKAKPADAALDEKQLDKVSGGGISNACVTGKHISTGTIST